MHTHPCLEYHIHRCLGPCVEGLTTDEAYAAAVRDVRLFLEGRHQGPGATSCARAWKRPPRRCASKRRPGLRDLLTTVEEMEQKQKMAAAEGDDTDIFAYYAEPPLVAVNLFHLRNGTIVDRREFFWEDQLEFEPPEFFSSLLKQIYLDQQYIPGLIHVPVDFEDRDAAGRIAQRKARPQSGDPHAAARAEESLAGAGGDQREAQLRAALPRAEAVLARRFRRRCRTR